jgi:hypothetical protein
MRSILSICGIAAAVTALTTTQLFAEQRVAIPGSTAPEAMCSVCESSDRSTAKTCKPRTDTNYCACLAASESPLRVLVRATPKAAWVSFETYLKQELKKLEKLLKKRKSSQKKIKQALAELRKKLQAKHANYKKSCQDAGGGGSSGGGGSASVIELNGFSVYFLSHRAARHTYAVSVSERGKVLGGAFAQEGQPRASGMPHTFGVAELPTRVITPLVWTGSTVKRACENCPPGLQLRQLNDQGKAVGTQLSAGEPRQTGVVFNYADETLSGVVVSGNKPHWLSGINEAGLIVGGVQREMSRSTPSVSLDDAAVWVGGGAATVISREALLVAHEKELAGLMLEQIKARLKEEQDINECGDGEIAQTSLVGKPTFVDWLTINGLEITASGDILGTIMSPGINWSYTNPCTSGSERILAINSPFVRKAEGSLFVTPTGLLIPQTRVSAIPIGLTSNLTVAGLSTSTRDGDVFGAHGFVELSSPGALWRRVVYPGTEKLATLIPMGVNDRGDVVGSYTQTTADTTARAYAVLGGTFTDLTSLLGNQTEWRIETASDINSCGQIVGRAYNTKTETNFAVLISPKGCNVK